MITLTGMMPVVLVFLFLLVSVILPAANDETKKHRAHTQYRIDGKRVPSVTTIIESSLGWNKRTLIGWARREAMAGNDPYLVGREAMSIGSITHKMIEAQIKGEVFNPSKYAPDELMQATTAYSAYREFESTRQWTYTDVELKLTSEEYRYGGTCDAVALAQDGTRHLLDWKSSKGCHPEYTVQLAAYRHAYQESTGNNVDAVHLVRLDKLTGSVEHHVPSEEALAAAWEVFLHCRALYDLKKVL